MRALFLIFHGFSEHNGISKKIYAQVAAMRACGVPTTLCHTAFGEQGNHLRMVDDRVLRWSLTPVVPLLLPPLNVAMVCARPHAWLWWVLLAGQLAFCAAGFAGKMLSDKGVKKSPLIVPYYFIFMNPNVFSGARYLWRRKRKEVTSGAWEKAKRA
jgi:hypothetical protein